MSLRINKEEVLKGVSQENKIIISNILDKVVLSQKQNFIMFSDFIDAGQQIIVDSILKKLKINYNFYGGYNEAERKIVIIPNADNENFDNVPLSIIDITYKTNFGQNISHRDVLGVIISQGIKREKIGDILINEGRAQVIVSDDVCQYLLYNLNKINNVKVIVSIKNLHDVILTELKFKEINASVASLRLDCILEVGFGIPRSEASELINSERVFVNFEKIIKPSFNVKEGDKISARKFGRIIFERINGKTKKDRFSVSIKRFI